MKKGLILTLVVIMSVFSLSAFARGMHGHGGCYGGGPAWGIGGAEGGPSCPCPFDNRTVSVTSEADALKAVQDYLTANFKGYKTGGVKSQTMPRGHTAYEVSAMDTAGNNFVFFVGPYDHIKGPIPASALQQRPPRPAPRAQ